MTRSGSDFNFVSTSGGSSTTLMISLSQLLQINQSSVISVVEPLARRMKRYNFVRIFIVFSFQFIYQQASGILAKMPSLNWAPSLPSFMPSFDGRCPVKTGQKC